MEAFLKCAVADRMWQTVSARGFDRINVGELGAMADIVKDLACAEEKNRKAEYYRAVTDAMGRHGEPQGIMMHDDGYGDMLEELRKRVMSADPHERERMIGDIMGIVKA